MIVLFSANVNGGILQFINETAKSMSILSMQYCVFIPKETNVSFDESVRDKIEYYDRIKTINHSDTRLLDLTNRILAQKPDVVWFCDSIIQSTQLSRLIHKKCFQIMTVHDAGNFHPANNESIKKRLHDVFEGFNERESYRCADKLLLLSDESKSLFSKKYPNYESKLMMMRLGAHIPSVCSSKPKELDSAAGYNLFFGRIDKYKGIINLLRAYEREPLINTKLVIAGNGLLSSEELLLAENDPRVTLLNRYISDEEMVWMFENCNTVILPYIEASQSGVIPIAYRYKKPVIISDVAGLKQFVIQDKTGIVCKTVDDYCNAIIKLSDNTIAQKMGDSSYSYYNDNFVWTNNLKQLLNELGIMNHENNARE